MKRWFLVEVFWNTVVLFYFSNTVFISIVLVRINKFFLPLLPTTYQERNYRFLVFRSLVSSQKKIISHGPWMLWCMQLLLVTREGKRCGGIVLVSSVSLLLKYGLILTPKKMGTSFITKSPKFRWEHYVESNE